MYLTWDMWRLVCKLKEYQEWMRISCFLVVPDSNYTRRVPISIGTVSHRKMFTVV